MVSRLKSRRGFTILSVFWWLSTDLILTLNFRYFYWKIKDEMCSSCLDSFSFDNWLHVCIWMACFGRSTLLTYQKRASDPMMELPHGYLRTLDHWKSN
ncbi:hypothetical protein I79_025984 [Cricetulus griseus]|uniref:Uncharacterized protein n=1 Tax=Cricetulus griseus TaxID=10029 RepID=G3IPR5_CRIGR|nr:hypothetical protein I79_025984 [Cricetulus griseus]ERE72679.1 hypothetical protein H671_5g14831 [Cricetulus griseus]